MNHPRHNAGFSMIELIVAVLILAIVMGGAIAGWLYVLRGERMQSIQHELDMDVRKALERLKAELRLSSMDKIHFYPDGPGPYTAISFPLARDDDGDGVIELDVYDHILWDQTVVYHVWQSTPHQLRRTVFDPRDLDLTTAQRQQQLADVVTAGGGAGAANGANATTTAIFENLFTWQIHGKGAVFDAYSPTLARALGVSLGSFLLSSGSHDFKFTVIDRNPASTGYKVGLDTLVMSPSGLEREGEAQTVAAQSGATASADYRAAGSWSGNYHLLFPATAAGASFTLSMENDRWEETNFRAAGAKNEDTLVEFDTSLAPKDFVMRLQPAGDTWYAMDQTLDYTGGWTTNDTLQGSVVRVLVRGKTMMEGSAIKNNGPLNWIWFVASASRWLRITAAYIAEAADPLSYTPDAVAGTEKQLYFSGNPDVDIPPTYYALGMLGSGQSFWIDKEKSYLVTFRVTQAYSGRCDSRYWTELHTGTGSNPPPPGCYIIPGTNGAVVGDVTAATWSTKTNMVVDSRLYAVNRLHLLAPSNGVFTSQTTDTQLSAPAYQTMTWNSIRPSGTAVDLKVRTADNEDMSDAAPWSNLTAMASGGSITPGNRRYVQFQALMRASSDGWNVPSLKDVTIRWTGEYRAADIGGKMTTGPDYGIYELMVDNKPLVKGVSIDLTIFEDLMTIGGGSSNRLTSSATVEVEPRNTGK